MKSSIGHRVSHIYKFNQMLMNEALKEYEISSGLYAFLLYIHENSGVSQKELTKLSLTDKATTAKALKKLEQLGYIKRITNKEDKRYNQLYVTEKAVQAIPGIQQVLAKVDKVITANLSPEQCSATLQALEVIQANLQKAVRVK